MLRQVLSWWTLDTVTCIMEGRNRGERNVTTEAEIGAIQPRVRTCWPSPEPGRDKEQILSRASGVSMACWCLDFDLDFELLASRTVERINFCCLKPLCYSNHRKLIHSLIYNVMPYSKIKEKQKVNAVGGDVIFPKWQAVLAKFQAEQVPNNTKHVFTW